MHALFIFFQGPPSVLPVSRSRKNNILVVQEKGNVHFLKQRSFHHCHIADGVILMNFKPERILQIGFNLDPLPVRPMSHWIEINS